MSELGYKVAIYFNEGNQNNKLVHVLAEVEGMLVCKTWMNRRQEWSYTVEHPCYFERLIANGQASIK